MSIMAILAYFCVFNFRGMSASLGTLTELTLFRMYFHGIPFDYYCFYSFHCCSASIIRSICIHFQFAGECAQSGMPNIDFAPISEINLIKSVQIHICMWIYCSISTVWLISSITLLTSTCILIKDLFNLLD